MYVDDQFIEPHSYLFMRFLRPEVQDQLLKVLGSACLALQFQDEIDADIKKDES